MNTDQIREAFARLIGERAVHKRLGVTSDTVRSLRHSLKAGNVSLDKQISMLRKAGLMNEDKTYTRADLIAFVKFYNTTSQAARDMGPEYVIEKWERS